MRLPDKQKQPPNWQGHRQFGRAVVSYRWSAERTARLGGSKLSAEDVRRLYDQHGPALVAYACGFLTDAAAAEDAVHQVFLRLLSAEITMPDAPVANVYRAVRNAALNARRNGLRLTELDPQSSVFRHRGGNQEAALALEKALAELPEEQREVVVMRAWSGLTLEEIAAATAAPLNTIASRYRYALEKLRQRLQPYERNENGQMKMENDGKKFEEYLGEFQPRKPRALPALIVHRQAWPRRLAAAAAIAMFLGASLWFVRRKNELISGEPAAKNSTSTLEAESPARPLALLPLTRLALENPEQVDAQLTAASRRVLPDFRGSNSTLRVLAKE